MPKIPKNLYSDYEKLLLKNILAYSKRIQRLYNNAIVEVTLSSATIRYTSDTFTLDLYPAIRSKIDQVLREMQKEMLITINHATKDAWDLANKKNDIVTKSVLGKRSLPAGITDKYFNPNLKAYLSFISRKDAGINLAERIWKTIKPFKFELEAGLADGINKGRSAAAMASDMKRYLKEPDKLFRRVMDDNGKLRLSRAARAYHPGQGVYRSSFKNAFRLTRSETNLAYAYADYERWNKADYVLGIRIRVSNNHPTYDFCDILEGDYPKTFKWGKWHTQCRCVAVPILASQKDFDKRIDDILGISKKPVELKYITEMPANFTDYMAKNSERIKGWKSTPYWAKDNPELVRL